MVPAMRFPPLRLAAFLVHLVCLVAVLHSSSAETTAVAAVKMAPAYEVAARAGAEARLFTVGHRGVTQLRGALALSNGEFLLTGAAEDFSWAKAVSPTRLGLPSTSLPGSGGTTTPFLLHVSADFETLKGLYTLPAGAITEITRIRSTEVPGQPTEAILISGRFAGLAGPSDAYWIARLDGNGVDKPIRKLEWLHVVKAPGDGPSRDKPARPGDFAERQPWDVRSDGQVVYAEGEPYAMTWAALRVLSADGKTGFMPGWGDENGPVVALKAGRKNSLRSRTLEDFEHRQEDENGNPGRKGRFPDDVFFSAFDSDRGPGYTGYRVGQNATQRVSQIAIDRRDNALYFGTSTQSRLPGGLPDFEPAIVAMNADGSLRWWARGYVESTDGNNSPPDQYVDHVAVDYARNHLLVAARCHGNNIINLWRGDSINRNRGRPGFKVGFTGRFSDIHISWLGRYGLNDGGIYGATFVAELAEGRVNAAMIPEGPLAGWPSPNANIDLTTTRILGLEADRFGRAVVLGFGRRPFTTAGALIENVKPGAGQSHWTHFLRSYEPDLGAVDYSTILRGAWDPATGKSAGDTQVFGSPLPLADGVLVIGGQSAGPEGRHSALPLRGAPAWGGAQIPSGASEVGIVVVVPKPAPLAPPGPINFAPEEPTRRRR